MIAYDAERLIVALDYANPDRARELARHLEHLQVSFKIGLELFMTGGPPLIAEFAERYRIFLDLKFHDIPSTVAAAVAKAASLGVWMLNVHAAGGRAMLLAAREAIQSANHKPLLLAVTVLTSLKEENFREIAWKGSSTGIVKRLSGLAAECGFDGVVCSPLEIGEVKKAAAGLLTVTPGVRPGGALDYDQARTAGPEEVIAHGGDYLVVGRPITASSDPVKAAADLLAVIRGGRL